VPAAALTAAGWRATQCRKGKACEPYINHHLEVALMSDADLIAAALLHDALEDQGISRQAIAAMFGRSRWRRAGSD
jgi:GTP diphosphokinase / guanosine-3',5'-bis(diphosphate) 3'-diphosphatase